MIEISKKEDCCACGACIQRCPVQCMSLREDEEGFLYPEIDQEKCIDCGVCTTVCPILHPNASRIPFKVYAAKHREEKMRLQSSSGGVFTPLAEQVIGEGGVVFGARFDEAWEVIHDSTDTLAGLAAFRGSKYVQSRIGTTYQHAESYLKEGRKVLFSGTPCQISGLKKYLRKDYPGLCTVDFICHGVPSPKVWRMYLQELVSGRSGTEGVGRGGTPESTPRFRISSVSFRDKKYGWQDFSVLIQGVPVDPRETKKLYLSERFDENPYIKGFLSNLYLRPSCYACAMKSGKSGSDVTIADYWGIQDVHPDFYDSKGVSLVLEYSKSFDREVLGKEMWTLESSYQEVIKYNPSVENSCVKPDKRHCFFQRINDGSLCNLIEKCTRRSIFQRGKNLFFRILRGRLS